MPADRQRPPRIRKDVASLAVAPNWRGEANAGLSDVALRSLLGGPAGGALNIGVAAVDRHAQGPRAERIALHWLGAEGGERRISYRELARASNRFANALTQFGLRRGDCLFVLAPRLPELYIAVLGGLKAGLLVSPLFSAFGPEPIATRMNLGAGRALVTTAALYQRKVAPVRARIASLEQVILIGDGDGHGDGEPLPEDCSSLDALLRDASDAFTAVPTRPDEPALLHFTSGTTGRPKGAVHVHEAALTHYATGLYALDLHDDDIFWCTADPGWVTGMSYGILAPLLHGVTLIVDEAEFDPERWYRILQDQRVSVWYTAPTAIRMLMKAGSELARRFAFPDLRFIASVGEPLNPEAVWWGLEAFGQAIHDNWWQTETGGIMIANTLAQDIKPGSMGKPLPGVEACVVERLADGGLKAIDAPDIEGELALRRGWPSMFRGYLNEDERYRKSFVGDWYLSGDLARRDSDGYYWFVGRADDVIKSAGHLIGPFEVESALMEHPAVVEAGVIGKPDALLGETVKAFVALRPGFIESEALRRELLAHARKRLGPAVAPKEIAFIAVLPRTRSGKIMRRLLKARELGLPEGDTSTLEAGA
ncbi:MAG: acetate--CoA ligase [Burkholderiaceae bacterium]|nr:acetate--CoA ligase [Burkholderiaceae bacterium]